MPLSYKSSLNKKLRQSPVSWLSVRTRKTQTNTTVCITLLLKRLCLKVFSTKKLTGAFGALIYASNFSLKILIFYFQFFHWKTFGFLHTVLFRHCSVDLLPQFVSEKKISFILLNLVSTVTDIWFCTWKSSSTPTLIHKCNGKTDNCH